MRPSLARACLAPASLALASCLAAAPAHAEDPLPVEVVIAHTAPVIKDFALAGTLEATDSYPASFRDGGRVIALSADVGDRVAKGTVLAQLDPTQAEGALRAAEAGLRGAEAALLQAGLARDRAQGLLSRGSGTQAELDAATETWLGAQAQRDQAAAALSKARRAVDDTTLRAVEASIVTARDAEPGQVVGAGQAVLQLAVATGREAVFLAPDGIDLESYLGETLSLSPIDQPDLSFTAVLTEVSPIVAQNGTVRVKAQVAADAPADLPIGTAVLGHANFTNGPRIVLPWTALTATASGPAVWVLDAAGDVRLTPVEVSGYADQTIEISGGLAEGAQVVAAGSQMLYPGRAVVAAQVQP
jgi:RND family efflux transporter MFP subunit